MERSTNFYDADTYAKAEELAAFVITETPFKVKDAGVASHNIHYWISQGVFPQNKDSRNIKMNFVDYVWLKILAETRAAGLPVESLKGLYKELVKPMNSYALYSKMAANPSFIDKELLLPEPEKIKLKEYLRSGQWKTDAQKESPFSPLLLMIAEAISKRTFVSIAIFVNGGHVPLVEETSHLLPSITLRRLKTETHLVISITNILSTFLGDERFHSIIPNLNCYSAEEIKLLEQVRSGKYDEIKIRFSNKKMDYIELKKNEDVHKRIVDILSENNFQSIEISTQHGKISRVVRSVKMKV